MYMYRKFTRFVVFSEDMQISIWQIGGAYDVRVHGAEYRSHNASQ